MHLVAADARTAVNFRLSRAMRTTRRKLLRGLGPMPQGLPLLMDRAYENKETRVLVRSLGMAPVRRRSATGAPMGPRLYKRRNEIERLFRRLKGFRRVFTRFDKFDALSLGFFCLALIVEALRECQQALVW